LSGVSERRVSYPALTRFADSLPRCPN